MDVTFVRIEGGGHGIGGPDVMKRFTAFFEKHLHGEDIEISADPIEAVSKSCREAVSKLANPDYSSMSAI